MKAIAAMLVITRNLGFVQRIRVLHPVLLLTATMGFGMLPVHAANLPSPTSLATCFDPLNLIVNDLTKCSEPNASASLTLSPFVRLVAEASLPTPGLGALSIPSAKATLQYSFEVIGGNANDAVPLLVDTNLSTQTGPVTLSTIALAEIGLVDPSGRNVTQAGACTATLLAHCPPSFNIGSFSGTLKLEALSGAIYRVIMEVDASGADQVGIFNVPFASASADPFIHIDPAFSAASNYSILLSPGVGNSPVPEPSTLALLGLGLAGFAVARKREHSGFRRG